MKPVGKPSAHQQLGKPASFLYYFSTRYHSAVGEKAARMKHVWFWTTKPDYQLEKPVVGPLAGDRSHTWSPGLGSTCEVCSCTNASFPFLLGSYFQTGAFQVPIDSSHSIPESAPPPAATKGLWSLPWTCWSPKTGLPHSVCPYFQMHVLALSWLPLLLCHLLRFPLNSHMTPKSLPLGT